MRPNLQVQLEIVTMNPEDIFVRKCFLCDQYVNKMKKKIKLLRGLALICSGENFHQRDRGVLFFRAKIWMHAYDFVKGLRSCSSQRYYIFLRCTSIHWCRCGIRSERLCSDWPWNWRFPSTLPRWRRRRKHADDNDNFSVLRCKLLANGKGNKAVDRRQVWYRKLGVWGFDHELSF